MALPPPPPPSSSPNTLPPIPFIFQHLPTSAPPWTFMTPPYQHPYFPYTQPQLHPSPQLPALLQPSLQSSKPPPPQQPAVIQPSQAQTQPHMPFIHKSKHTKPQPKSSEVRGNSFRIDSKKFSLGFDGGRVDSYHIMETKTKFQGSMWLGKRGLRWMLGEMGKMRHISSTSTGIFKFLRDGYQTL